MRKGALIINLRSCSNRCVFCSDANEAPTPDKLKRIETGLKKDIAVLRKGGVAEVEISGQDPIEYPKIVPLVRSLKRAGFRRIELLTHARNMSDARLVRGLASAGVNQVRIPLYGSSPKVHDAAAMAPGAFKQTLRALNHLKKLAPKINVVLTTMILRQNRNDLLATVKLMAKHSRELNLAAPYPKGHIPYREWAAPFSRVRRQLLLAKKHCLDQGVYLHFLDIPYCIFGFAAPYIQNYGSQPVRSADVSA